MSIHNTYRLLRNFLPSVAFLIVAMLASSASAQSAGLDTINAKMETRVALRLGKTTLANVVAALSEQTGLKIGAESYLLDRELIVQMNDISLSMALESLAELNEWRVIRTPPDRIFLTRQAIPLTQTTADLTPAFRASLPVDIRHYLGVDIDTLLFLPEKTADYVNFLKKQKPTFDISTIVQSNLRHRYDALAAKQRSLLFASFGDPIFQGKKIPVSEVTPEQQNMLITDILLETFHAIATNDGGINILYGTYHPYQLDSSHIEIHYRGGSLHALSPTGDANGNRRLQGFAEQIVSPQALPNPLGQGSAK